MSDQNNELAEPVRTLGDFVIAAVTETGALKSVLFRPDGSQVFVWQNDAAERIERGLHPVMAEMGRQAVLDPASIDEALAMMKVGLEQGHTAPQVMQRVLCSFAFRMLGIDVPQPQPEDAGLTRRDTDDTEGGSKTHG